MKSWVKLLLIFGGIGVVIAIAIHFENQRRASMTAEGVATVTNVTLVRDREDNSEETTVEFSFEAGGAPVAAQASLYGDQRESYRQGQQVRICFNPEDPVVADIREQEPCGG
ncbi:MAG: DUF3592 domain-containing protein [Allosphingosinicella sp.]|uniref:DUF3592 domain-containing protein n=1 Tax=Allosphingosinicella sp. TaxID=2823234 RepID=UPI003922E57B